MAVNRRLIIWLVRAYMQKWGKAIFLFFIVGLIVFFLLQTVLTSFVKKITSENKQVIGVVGTYTIDTLPQPILSLISRGLTQVASDDTIKPDLATSWRIQDNGKTYVFTLKRNEKFSDGTPFTSKEITTSFTNVTTTKPNDYTIVFHLKDVYAPFLVTVSRPIFRSGFIGIGQYRVTKVNQNDAFVQSLALTNMQNGSNTVFQFYPTEDALKVAFALGEISSAKNLSDTQFLHTNFTAFSNVTLSKTTDYTTLVTLFYNTTDKVLSDSKLREAFSYAIPNTLPQGERAYSPISPLSWAYQNTNPHTQDFAHAKLLVEASLGTDPKQYPTLIIDTLPKYEFLARSMQTLWKKIGVTTKIEIVSVVPSSFQIYLGDFHVPQDPDQYTLWHSYQDNNITNLNKDVRIDKLLEDGRKTIDQTQRAKTYADFQKYLNNDQPATFLYFPYSFTLTRK